MQNVAFEFVFGLALGFSLTIPPGPMNAYIAAQSVRSRRHGLLSGLGAMSADAVLGAAVYLLSAAVDLGAFAREVYGLGGVVMAYFGLRLLLRRGPAGTVAVGDARVYSAALGLGLANPFQIFWWLTAGLAFAYLGGPVLLVGLFGAIAVWIVAFPLAIRAGAERSTKVAELVTIVSGGAMLVFAGYFAFLAAS